MARPSEQHITPQDTLITSVARPRKRKGACPFDSASRAARLPVRQSYPRAPFHLVSAADSSDELALARSRSCCAAVSPASSLCRSDYGSTSLPRGLRWG